jgi:hypothetical protein
VMLVAASTVATSEPLSQSSRVAVGVPEPPFLFTQARKVWRPAPTVGGAAGVGVETLRMEAVVVEDAVSRVPSGDVGSSWIAPTAPTRFVWSSIASGARRSVFTG